MASEEIDLGRVAWRSRRGLLELDLLLPPFVAERFRSLTSGQRSVYLEFLACDDQDIWDWLQARSVPDDPRFAEIVALINEFNAARGRA